MGEYETMLKKLPLVVCLVYMYNYCCNRKCKDCRYYSKQYGRYSCCGAPNRIIPIYKEFCTQRTTCEDCNLNNNLRCEAQYAVKKFIIDKERENLE